MNLPSAVVFSLKASSRAAVSSSFDRAAMSSERSGGAARSVRAISCENGPPRDEVSFFPMTSYAEAAIAAAMAAPVGWELR